MEFSSAEIKSRIVGQVLQEILTFTWALEFYLINIHAYFM